MRAAGESAATWRTWLLLLHLALHYSLWMGMVLVGRPEREVSTGLHETLGRCDSVVPLQTASGLVSAAARTCPRKMSSILRGKRKSLCFVYLSPF